MLTYTKCMRYTFLICRIFIIYKIYVNDVYINIKLKCSNIYNNSNKVKCSILHVRVEFVISIRVDIYIYD